MELLYAREYTQGERAWERGYEKYVCLYFIPPVIFSSNFWLVVIFSHVLHLDALRRQIELKLNVKTEISICMAIMQNHPLPSLYTQYYRTM